MKIKGFRDWLVVWHGRESVVSLIMSITELWRKMVCNTQILVPPQVRLVCKLNHSINEEICCGFWNIREHSKAENISWENVVRIRIIRH